MSFVEARIVFFNVRGARFSSDSSWDARKGQVIKRMNRVLEDGKEDRASLYVLVECRKNELVDIRKAFPSYGVVSDENSGTTLLYQKSKWEAGRKWTQNYNTGTHGALISEFTYKENDKRFNLVGAHLVPFSWRQAKRETDMKRLLTTVDGWEDPTIIGLDSNWDKKKKFQDFVAKYGFNTARYDAINKIRANYRSTGDFEPGVAIDFMCGSKKDKAITWRGFRVMKGWGSDHHMQTGQVTIGQPPAPKPDTT